MATFGAFSAPGRWFRGNCHTHTLLSDGKAERRADRAGVPARGIRFRRADRSRAGAGDVVVGPGRRSVSWSSTASSCIRRRPDGGATSRITSSASAWSVRRRAEWVEKATAASVIRWIERARRRGGVRAILTGRGHDLGLMREGKRASGVEVFNSVCEAMRRPGRFERPPRPGAVGGHPLDGVRGGRHAPAGARRLRRVDHGQGARADAGRHPRARSARGIFTPRRGRRSGRCA